MLKHRLAKPVFFLLCLSPAIWMMANALLGDLGANPVETITHQSGDWALRILLLTLLLTPLKRWSGNAQFIRFRRLAGLFVYFYAFAHFTIWFLADHNLDPYSMIDDVIKRPYITLGFIAFVLLTPLAITSNRRMIKMLGKRWKTLHKLVYVITVLVLAHYLWLVKADLLEPVLYAIVAAFLLLQRFDLKPLVSRLFSRFQAV